jgi:glycosyltransferase involved in cell wall biosynthesis
MTVQAEKPSPRVTVGMPAYNAERFIGEAIESMLAQTFREVEIVISDNASTDGTAEICAGYVARDDRIRYVRNATNLGACRNYSNLVGMARGEYFKWASSNDTCHPDYVRRCVEVLDAHPDVVLVCSRTRLIEGTAASGIEYTDAIHIMDASPEERWKKYVLSREAAMNNAMNGLFRTEVLRRTRLLGSFEKSDVAMMAALTLHGKFYELDDVLFYRRTSPEASTMYRGPRERTEFYDPRLVGRIVLPTWRRHYEYLLGVLRAPIGLRRRLALAGFLARKLSWSRKECFAELRAAASAVMGRIAGRSRADSGA